VLDIQAVLPASTRLKHLEALHHGIQDRYPNRRTRKRIEGRLDFRAAGELQVTQGLSANEDGYLFSTRDGKRIVQARLDGFTFNQLKPYGTWEVFRDEAKEHWKTYLDIAHPDSVTRIALRYINRIELPLPIGDFKDYLKIAPDILAANVPHAVQNFFLRLEIPYASGALALVTETILPPEDPASAKTLPFILDIDVIRAEVVDPPFSGIWDKFEELRQIKNDIFFGTITPLAEALFQ